VLPVKRDGTKDKGTGEAASAGASLSDKLLDGDVLTLEPSVSFGGGEELEKAGPIGRFGSVDGS
jgi:hypothetical protein